MLEKDIQTKARKNGIWTKHDTDHNSSSDQRHQSSNNGSLRGRDPANSKRPAPAMPKGDGPVLKLPNFDSKSPDKYIELCNFEIEVKKHIPNQQL